MSELNAVINWYGGLNFEMQIMIAIILMALMLTRVSTKKVHR